MDLTEPVLLTPEGLEKLKRDLEVALRRRAEALLETPVMPAPDRRRPIPWPAF